MIRFDFFSRFLGARRQARPHFGITAARANQGIRRVKLT